MQFQRTALLVSTLTIALLAACAGEDGEACTLTEADGETFLECPDGTSTVIEDGEDGSSCSVTDHGDGTSTVSCDDGTEVTIEDGDDGQDGDDGEDGQDGDDGASCSVVDNDDGTYTLSCDDGTEVTIEDGDDGQDGEDGEDGDDGDDGQDGSSCSVVDNDDGTYTLSCDDGTEVTIEDGDDGQDGDDGDDGQDGDDGESCSVTDNGDGTATLECPDDPPVTIPVVVDDTEEIIIELAWEQADWESGDDVGPDLDLFYCNNDADDFEISTTGDCVFWQDRDLDWEIGDDTYSVSLDIDSLDPDDDEIISHQPFDDGHSHIGVHFWQANGFPDVEADVSIFVGDVLWFQTSQTIGQTGDFWYAGIIDWSNFPAFDAFQPGPDCQDQSDADCTGDVLYDGFPVPIDAQ